MRILKIHGNFTMLSFVEGFCTADLEARLGYEKGRLRSGYALLKLADTEKLGPDDFELEASTRWSGGKMPGGLGINDVLLSHGHNKESIRALKEKVAAHFRDRPGNRPAKILPNFQDDGHCRYPDAEALGPGLRSGVPSFVIPESKPREFVVIKTVEAAE